MAKWKQISKLMAEMHNTHGRSAVTMGGENAFAKAVDSELSFKEISEAHLLASWKDVELTPKMIRRWMWDIRQDKVLKEDKEHRVDKVLRVLKVLLVHKVFKVF